MIKIFDVKRKGSREIVIVVLMNTLSSHSVREDFLGFFFNLFVLLLLTNPRVLSANRVNFALFLFY